MDANICPACRAENDEDAAYCDQCGQNLAPAEAAEDGGGCPACGGEVQDNGDGTGTCRSCGLELKDDGAQAPPPQALDGDVVAHLTAAILKRTSQGMPVEAAVAEACREAFAPAAGPAHAAPGADKPCPVCGTPSPANAARCPGCGIWFGKIHAPGACPSCGKEAKGDKCACGAIMTLPALLELLEPSVRFLCSKCKQPYAALRESCADCGGKLTTAQRLQDFARPA